MSVIWHPYDKRLPVKVLQDILAALERGSSTYSLEYVIDQFEAGNLYVLLGDSMTGSFWHRDGHLEVVHVAGKWNKGDMLGFIATIDEIAKACVLPWRWQGRRGWARMFKKEGIKV